MDRHEEIRHLVESIAILRCQPVSLDLLQRIETLQACLAIVIMATYGERRNNGGK